MSIRLNGSTSGYTEIDAPAVAGSNTLVLPTGNGSSGQYLQTNGSGTLSWASVSGLPAQALTAATSVSASGTSIDFTSIPSTVKRITIIFQGVSSNGASANLVQLGTSGGFTTSGYSSSGGVAYSGGSAANSATNGFYGPYAASAGEIVSGIFVFTNITGNTWVGGFSGGSAGGTLTGSISGGGHVALGGTLTQVRITHVNGTDTFDAGTINIMYEG